MPDIFNDPLFTPREVSNYLTVPQSTVYSWLQPVTSGPQLVHHLTPEKRGAASVPFVALVEAYVLRSLRDLRLTKRQIRLAVQDVRDEFGTEYALATKRIATDGVDVFFEYADGELARVGDKQRPIREIIDGHLRFITFDKEDGYASRLKLPKYAGASVIIDPRFGWGVPVVEKNRVPVSAIIDLYSAGESMQVVADEYGLTVADVEAVCRAALTAA